MQQDEDWDLFSQEMGDIQPLKQDKVLAATTSKKMIDPQAMAEHLYKLKQHQKIEQIGLTTGYVDPIDPYDPLDFKKDGVQDGVYKNLRQAKYSITSRLDLRQRSVEQARLALFEFIHQSQNDNHRCLLIQHGLGLNNQPHPAVIKSYLNNWLECFEQVLAYHSAPKNLGGLSATLVLLKKSDEKKRETKEHIQKRLG